MTTYRMGESSWRRISVVFVYFLVQRRTGTLCIIFDQRALGLLPVRPARSDGSNYFLRGPHRVYAYALRHPFRKQREYYNTIYGDQSTTGTQTQAQDLCRGEFIRGRKTGRVLTVPRQMKPRRERKHHGQDPGMYVLFKLDVLDL